jgi:ATP-dependent RNA helicase DHX57
MPDQRKQKNFNVFAMISFLIHLYFLFRNYRKDAPEPKNPHKTEMQVLNLKEESQNLIISTLKSIHGDHFEFNKIDDYRNKRGTKIKKSYWKERGELIIKGGQDLSSIVSTSNEGKMKLYKLLQLESYGFDQRHCLEALDAFEENIDDSINFLFDKYFPNRKRKEANGVDNSMEMTNEERADIMSDELESLKSILNEEVNEVERNAVWQFKTRCDFLLQFSPSEVKKLDTRKRLEAEARIQELQQMKLNKKKNKIEKCKNVLERGKCKYGAKCKFSHDIYRDDIDANQISSTSQTKRIDTSEHDRKLFTLEIRFPKWAKYPRDSPIILLRSKISDIPKSICLRINQRLIDESRELAKDQIPSVYSVVDLLKNEEEILSFLKKAESFSNFPSSDISIFDYDPDNASNDDDSEEEIELPSHFQMGKVDKFDKQLLTPEEVYKENVKLIRKFKEKESTQAYQKMMSVRKSLPAWEMKDKILETVK